MLLSEELCHHNSLYSADCGLCCRLIESDCKSLNSLVVTEGGELHSRQHSVSSQHSGPGPAFRNTFPLACTQIGLSGGQKYKYLFIYYSLFSLSFISISGDAASGESGDVEEDLWTTWGGSILKIFHRMKILFST